MTSHSEFNAATTATEVAAAFAKEIKGKIVLIVGVSPESIGEHLALSTAQQSPSHLIIASRTLCKMQEVISKMHAPETKIDTVTIDLGSQASIRRAASEILSLTKKIDVVINNAAINTQNQEFTEDGIEMHFGVNHVGLFLLTNLLKPVLTFGNSRVVNLSSAGHMLSPIRFSDPSMRLKVSEIPESERPRIGLPINILDPEKSYSSFIAYGQSKTANILFSISINEKWGGKCTSYSVHPGSIWTNLPRSLDEKAQKMIRNTAKDWKTGDQGAATAMVTAFDPKLGSNTSFLAKKAHALIIEKDVVTEKGVYFSDCQFAEANPWATDKEAAEKLWELSEGLVGQKFE